MGGSKQDEYDVFRIFQIIDYCLKKHLMVVCLVGRIGEGVMQGPTVQVFPMAMEVKSSKVSVQVVDGWMVES